MFFFLDEGNDDEKLSLLDLYQDPIPVANQTTEINENTQRPNIEEEKEGGCSIQFSSGASEVDSKLEARRMKGKIRSKQSRDRKKRYIEELEARVKDLEKENRRLQYTIDQYKKQTWSKLNSENEPIISTLDSVKKRLVDLFYDKETGQYNEKCGVRLADHFRANAGKVLNQHYKFIDKNFEMLIEQAIPFAQVNYWKDLDKEYVLNYEEIKKIGKLSKYKLSEFVHENKCNAIHTYISEFEPNKRQFELLKEILIPQEAKIRQKFKEAIAHILQAREIFVKSSFDLYVLRGYVLKSGIFSERQMVNVMLKEVMNPLSKIPFTEKWGIEKVKKEIIVDIASDPVLGPIGIKQLKPEDLVLSFNYESYKFAE